MNENITNKEKVISLYKFLKEFCKTNQKIICNDSNYFWRYQIDDIPKDNENIKVFYNDKIEKIDTKDAEEQNYLLKVHKPEFQKCPEPDDDLKKWLVADWNYHKNDVKIIEEIKTQDPDTEEIIIEKFKDDKKRCQKYEEWIQKRNIWQQEQIKIEITRNFFTEIYNQYIDLEKDSETKELIIANGYIKDRRNEDIYHPILTKRLNITFDAIENTIYIINTDAKTELYSELFQIMDDINLESLPTITSDLLQNEYHPMDRHDTKEFLKILVHKLTSDSKFIDNETEDKLYSNRILMFFKPCIIMRKRLDGTVKALEKIIKNIEQTDYIPKHMIDVVSGGKLDKPEIVEESIEESLAKTGGESVDILLCKEANREQLEIAKRIEMYNAVLVQGPPGTGKTHTIANLVGHFLAQGKSILVTSYTKKALTVLKEKLPKTLQSLCVSVLDESNEDMEETIDGITDYMSKTTSFELKKQMDEIKEERIKIINDLSSIRKKIYNILNSEYNGIVINGEEISPSNAARFVLKNKEKLSYINGSVKSYSPLPITKEEFDYLYSTNSKLSFEEEKELKYSLPNPSELIKPLQLTNELNKINEFKIKIKNIESEKAWKININNDDIFFETNFGNFYISNLEEKNIKELENYINNFATYEEWSKIICCDGKRGGAYKKRWITLIENIKQTSNLNDKILEHYFGKILTINKNENLITYKPTIEKMKKVFSKKGKISKIDLLINNDFNKLLSKKIINDNTINSLEDCEYLLNYINLKESRDNLAKLWDNLMKEHGIQSFYSLDEIEPEKIAEKWIDGINYYLNWYNHNFKKLIELLKKANFPDKIILNVNNLDKDIEQISKIFDSIKNIIPNLIKVCNYKMIIDKSNKEIYKSITILEENPLINSTICINMKNALINADKEKYLTAFQSLENIYKKYEILTKRNKLLGKIEEVAPGWAKDIRNRVGIHGNDTAPIDIVDAWKYKQYTLILEDMAKEPLEELQKKSRKLSLNYRKITEKYAEKCAWYNLLLKTECDIDMKQALKGWELTTKKIGRGTGKNAPLYKAKARELMAKCQNAVPCWIMTINKAMESLNPEKNKFDIIIIDEASQANISSLAISYLAKKMIIVGDDKQVSPMAVGIEVDKINTLAKTYIKNKIPNYHLYSAQTSLYDIAATTYQPLMLKEHFRCVPEIIGFSNMLSYDFKIKPLRDSESSNLLPAVINYRVQGKRTGKTNKVEAETIIAYIKGCLDIKEYDGKTFGVISLLGDEQVKLIQTLMLKYIEQRDIEKRKILVGNSSNFQGDERDVIFLSMVDSRKENEGPLAKLGNGVEDSIKKRYNVAVSRARDQIWIIHSLDASNDLKPGDIRKRLLDYAKNPKALSNKELEIKNNSDSIFEEEVAKKLISEGYHISQQYPVGAYKLDIVVICKNRKVAIECDGERYHSGEEKIREDMQRQAILERIGWKFIRIRGSQYFRDPIKTMEQVIDELKYHKIYPENIEETSTKTTSELLEKVKIESKKNLNEIQNGKILEPNYKDISYALNFNSKEKDIYLTTIQNKKDNNIIKNSIIDDNNKIWESNQFKYMILYSEGVGRKDIALYYKVTYDTVKKALQTIAAKYNVSNVDNCINIFKKEFSNTNKYKSVIIDYRLKEKNTVSRTDVSNKINSFKKNIESIDTILEEKELIEELEKNSIDFIDNREKSAIIWILNDKTNEELIKHILEKYKYSFTFEKRGSIVTNNKPAWRIMYK